MGFGCGYLALSLSLALDFNSILRRIHNAYSSLFCPPPQVMERTERERTLLRSDNAKLKREVELWKMKAQVAESGQ